MGYIAVFSLNLQYMHAYWSASIGHPYIAHAFSNWQAERAFLVVSINGRFICDGHFTYRHVMCASNFVCTLSYIHALTLSVDAQIMCMHVKDT